MAKKSATTRLELAGAALADITRQIAALQAERNAALIADDDKKAAKLFAELEGLRVFAQGHADKVDLLAAEVELERAADVVRRHNVLLARFEKTLSEADERTDKASEYLSLFWTEISAAIDLRERARAAFSVRSPHARAAAEAVEGCAMGASAVMTLVEYEFYRISARPLVGGTPGARSRPSLPGAKPPSIEVTLMPHKIVPLVVKLKAASSFAVATLKAEIGTCHEAAEPEPAPARLPPTPLRDATEIQREVQAEAEARDATLPAEYPAAQAPIPATNGRANEQRELTPAETRLSALLNKQIELANDVSEEGEQRYRAVVAKIGAAQAAVNAEQGNRA